MQHHIETTIQFVNEKDISTFITTDGRGVIIRPILESDAGLLVELFYRLSVNSIWLRFHTSAGHQVPIERVWQEAKRLTHLDPHCQAALVAIVPEADKTHIVGVARFCRATPQDTEAEVAIIIRDDFQRVGLGTYMVSRLVQVARSMSIQRFIAWLLTANHPALHLLKKSGLPVKQKCGRGEIQVQISLTSGALGNGNQ